MSYPTNFAPARITQVDEVLGDKKVTMEDFRALRYTTRVINEAMRLYPQVTGH